MAGNRKKRRRSSHPGKLVINDAVEVRSFEVGLLGSWHPAKVIARERKRCLVEYDLLVCDDQEKHLSEYVDISSSINGICRGLESSSKYCGKIRPTPPKVDLSMPLQYSMCVDAYYQDAWWEGVVFDHQDACGEWKLFFPELGDELSISTDDLRLTQDWNEATGEWSLRGKWLFLEIIEELKPDYVSPVSIKQMWYDLRESQKFQWVTEWTFQGKAVWKELILEVINGYLEIIADEFVSTVYLSQDLVVYNKSMCTPDCTRNSELKSAKVDAAVPAENLGTTNSIVSMETEAGINDLERSDHSHGGSMVPVPSNVQEVFEQPNTLLSTPSIQEKHSSTKRVGKPSCSSRVSKLPTAAEECPNCVAEYLKSKKHGYELTMKLKQHLLFLGWKIGLFVSGGMQRIRYSSPDGKNYYSLVKVCEDLHGIVPAKSSCDVKEINEKHASLSNSSDNVNTSALKIVLGKSSRDVKEINENASPSPSSEYLNASALETAESVASVYCPEAITEYLQHWDVCFRTKKKKPHQILSEKARQHLSAIGWKLWYTPKNGRQEARYGSPEQKNYYSLRTACKAAMNAALISGTLQRFSKDAQSGGQPLSPNSDLQRSMVPLMQQSEETTEPKSVNSVNSKLLKRKRNHLICDRQPISSIQRRSKLNEMENGFAEGLQNIGKCNLLRKLSARSMPKKRKVTSALSKTIDGSDINKSNRVLRSRKRARQVMTHSTLPCNPRTVLSWLIDKEIVLPRAKVYYRGTDNTIMAEGKVTRDGIKCGCCQNVLTLAVFESHARSPYHQPAAHIFFEDGRSLVNCQMQVLRDRMKTSPEDTVGRKRKNMSFSTNDHICSVCHFGGELILCDRCPSSFHANCLNLQGVPDGDWFCPSCCCAICDRSQPVNNTVYLNEKNTLCCDQCELLFHVSCLGSRGVNLDGRSNGEWFCCRTCAKIYKGLQKLERKTVSLGHDNLTWTLIKPMQYQSEEGLSEADINMMAENHSKLSLALEVMHECFVPVEEPRTRRDIVEDVIFGRGSELKRLNFTGFYTILLEKNDELVSVATLRIYGEKVAEVPLVGTRFKYRQLGMCRILMNELEKVVKQLGIERLVLPAVPNVLNTWTRSFGFTEMTASERSEFLSYTFLDFQGTVMCHKLMRKPTLSPSSIRRGCCPLEVGEIVDEHETSVVLDCKSTISEDCHGAQIEGCDSVGEGLLDIPKDSDNSGSKDPSSDAMAIPPINDQQCTATENKPEEVTENKDQPVVDRNACKLKGELKQYSRKKPLGVRPVPEVSCR